MSNLSRTAALSACALLSTVVTGASVSAQGGAMPAPAVTMAVVSPAHPVVAVEFAGPATGVAVSVKDNADGKTYVFKGASDSGAPTLVNGQGMVASPAGPDAAHPFHRVLIISAVDRSGKALMVYPMTAMSPAGMPAMYGVGKRTTAAPAGQMTADTMTPAYDATTVVLSGDGGG